MAGYIEEAVASIDAHLGELQGEVSRLEAARSALMGSNSSTTATPAPAPAKPRSSNGRKKGPGRPRGSRGDRSAQALSLVQERPGITIPQLAESMGIEANYLYRVMPKLVDANQVKRDGSGWFPVG